MMNETRQNLKTWRTCFVLLYLALFPVAAILIRQSSVRPVVGMAILLISMLLIGILMLQVFRCVACKQCTRETEEDGEPTST